MRRSHDQPTLITSAPESNDDEFDRRRRRYAIMMGTRALCVIGAAVTYNISTILAIAFAVAGVVLPWCAVIIANDRPPRKRRTQARIPQPQSQRALPARADDRTIDH
jgi:hypothetical protein